MRPWHSGCQLFLWLLVLVLKPNFTPLHTSLTEAKALLAGQACLQWVSRQEHLHPRQPILLPETRASSNFCCCTGRTLFEVKDREECVLWRLSVVSGWLAWFLACENIVVGGRLLLGPLCKSASGNASKANNKMAGGGFFPCVKRELRKAEGGSSS